MKKDQLYKSPNTGRWLLCIDPAPPKALMEDLDTAYYVDINVKAKLTLIANNFKKKY